MITKKKQFFSPMFLPVTVYANLLIYHRKKCFECFVNLTNKVSKRSYKTTVVMQKCSTWNSKQNWDRKFFLFGDRQVDAITVKIKSTCFLCCNWWTITNWVKSSTRSHTAFKSWKETMKKKYDKKTKRAVALR